MSDGATVERERRTTDALDAVYAEDPVRIVFDGQEASLQQTLGRVAAEWVGRLDSEADAIQRLAARAHHLRRWELARTDFPSGRAGYLRWRTAAKTHQADDLDAILAAQGWSVPDRIRARRLMRKEGLGRDPQVQTHEDAVCLAFLAVQLDAAVLRMGDDKALEVLRGTAAKMSPAALARVDEVPLSPQGRALVDHARGIGD